MVWFPCTDPLWGDDLTINNSKSSMHVDWWWKRFRFVCKIVLSHTKQKRYNQRKYSSLLPHAHDVWGKVMFYTRLSAIPLTWGAWGVLMSLPVMDSTSPPQSTSRQYASYWNAFLFLWFFFSFLFGVKGPLRSISFYILKPIFSKTLLPFLGLCPTTTVVSQCFSMDILTGKKLTSTYLLR